MGDGVRETGEGVREGEQLWMMYRRIRTGDDVGEEEAGTGEALGVGEALGLERKEAPAGRSGVDGADDGVRPRGWGAAALRCGSVG